jgi:uncharacterized membrane protein
MDLAIIAPQIFSISMEGTTGFLIRFGLNLITLFVLIRLLYYEFRKQGVPEYLFAFFLLGIIVFLICTALEMVEVQLGFALGLFALFGILRFRTESIPVREMTYLFLSIGVSMINSLVDFIDPINGIILSNTLIITRRGFSRRFYAATISQSRRLCTITLMRSSQVRRN